MSVKCLRTFELSANPLLPTVYCSHRLRWAVHARHQMRFSCSSRPALSFRNRPTVGILVRFISKPARARGNHSTLVSNFVQTGAGNRQMISAHGDAVWRPRRGRGCPSCQAPICSGNMPRRRRSRPVTPKTKQKNVPCWILLAHGRRRHCRARGLYLPLPVWKRSGPQKPLQMNATSQSSIISL